MNFTPEQFAKAKAAKNAEELIALAKENGIEMTEEEAKNLFAKLHAEGELADDELGNVSGGCGGDDDDDDNNGGLDPNRVYYISCSNPGCENYYHYTASGAGHNCSKCGAEMMVVEEGYTIR